MARRIAGLVLILLALLAACSQPDGLAVVSPTALPLAAETTAIEALPAATTLAEVPTSPPVTEDPYTAQRQEMVRVGIVGWGIDDERVIEVMGDVPRHEFVPEQYLDQAYKNHPLPIGHGQTISQPYIVALMTQAAEVGKGDVVLEIGTGSGYQAAVLAQLADHVYSIEIIEALADRARETLQRLGADNVTVRYADGYFGWEEHAPFDAIVVTAAPDHVPSPLVQQLKIGGRMIIPVGPVGGIQTLWLITRTSDEEVLTENLGEVRFVPLTREQQ